MEVDLSNDPDDQKSNSSSHVNQVSKSEAPLKKLIKSLLNIVHNEESTVLTNQHLVYILQDEFGIVIDDITDLELQIYITVLKKFLKQWPKWDDLDMPITKAKNNQDEIDEILETQYKNLKSYLEQVMILTKGQIRPLIDDAKNRKMNKPKEDKTSEIINPALEVNCSLYQLHHLFFKKPNIAAGNTIFNVLQGESHSKISLYTYSLKDIMNWPGILVSLNIPNWEFTRVNTSQICRTLINMKNDIERPDHSEPLSNGLKWRNFNQKKKPSLTKYTAIQLLEKLIDVLDSNSSHLIQKTDDIVTVLKEFKLDIELGPKNIITGVDYQFNMNKYKYIRRFQEDVPTLKHHVTKDDTIDPENFDLHLEEVLSPSQMFNIAKVTPMNLSTEAAMKKFSVALTDRTVHGVKVECLYCDVKFEGFLLSYNINQHFQQYHNMEPLWNCAKCSQQFTMFDLAQKRWKHDCE